jgi:hypothetical protein
MRCFPCCTDSRSIAEQHGGMLTCANAAAEHSGGAIVEMNLPDLTRTPCWPALCM